jgi:hypothetical protein
MTHFRKIHPLYCRCGDTNFTKNQRILNSLYLCISHIESHVIVAPQKKMIMRSLAIGLGKKNVVRNRVATELYLSQLGNRKISRKPLEIRIMVVATIFVFGSRLRKGKVLAPLTSVVLNGNLLVWFCYLTVNWLFICLLRVIRIDDRCGWRPQDGGNGRFFISVLAKIHQSPAYVSLWCNEEIRAFVVRATTNIGCVLFWWTTV